MKLFFALGLFLMTALPLQAESPACTECQNMCTISARPDVCVQMCYNQHKCP